MANTEVVKSTYGGGSSWRAAPAVNSIGMVDPGNYDLKASPYRVSDWITVSSAEILALRATNKTLVAAPGSGYVNQFLGAILIYDYATAYTESGNDNLAINYTDAAGAIASEALEATGLMDATSDQIRHMVPAIVSPVVVANAALTLDNQGSGELSGGTSILRVKVFYAVHDTQL